jgi:hypothetical protein
MTATEFCHAYLGKSYLTWEKAAIELAQAGDVPPLGFTTLQLSSPGHSATLDISNDYFQVGTAADPLRLPLTPKSAQTIANIYGYLLPTPKLVYESWKQAPVKLCPISSYAMKPPQSNSGASLVQYASHNAAVQQQLSLLPPEARSSLISGQKKDVVISKLLKPGKVIIYGWFHNDDRPLKETYQSMLDGTSQPIQPRSDAHGDFYVDYSHGIRFVSPLMIVDGVQRRTEDVLGDPSLAPLASDEGPLSAVRYPAWNAPQVPVKPAMVSVLASPFVKPDSITEQGLLEMVRRKL